MPELPEVETIARQLAPLLEGRRIIRVELLDQRLKLDGEEAVGSVIKRVARFGKRLVFELDNRGRRRFLRFDLRMTGRLVWGLMEGRPDERHLRAVIVLDNGALLFHDPRRFGEIRLFDSLDEARPAGFEPLEPGLNPDLLAKLTAGSRQALKVWLLRQDRLAGIGNIYASEILFAAGLRPERPASGLSPKERGKLVEAIRTVLSEAIRHRGTTLSDYRDARGIPGGHQSHLRVYGRENEACPRCGALITRTVQQGRSTFFCPCCQT